MKNTATKAQAAEEQEADASEESDNTDIETDSDVSDVEVQKDVMENREDNDGMECAQSSLRNTIQDPKRKRPVVESLVNSSTNEVLIYYNNKIT